MTKKFKYNNIEGKYKTSGESIIHQESGAMVGRVFSGSSVIAQVVSEIGESEEVSEVLEEIL